MRNYYELSQKLKAVQNQIRLEIIDTILRAPASGITVSEIENIVCVPQSRVSQQLNILKHAKLVKPNRKGNHVFYKIADKKFFETIAPLFD